MVMTGPLGWDKPEIFRVEGRETFPNIRRNTMTLFPFAGGLLNLSGCRKALLLAGLISGAAAAASINVNTTRMLLESDGLCGLREAILAASTGTDGYGCPAGDPMEGTSIYLDVAGTYRAGVELVVSTPVYIGCTTGHGTCVVEPASTFSGTRIFRSTTSGLFNLYNVTVRQPSANTLPLSGILVERGRLSLDRVRISGFRQIGLSLLTTQDHVLGASKISGNGAAGIFLGPGAILHSNNDTLFGNGGAGVSLEAEAILNFHSGRITGNGGAGISLSAGGRANVSQSLISDNTGSGVAGTGHLNLSLSVIRNNQDGGVRIDGSQDYDVYIDRSAIEFNRTSGNGGGISVRTANLFMTASTVSNNKAGQNGGGIHTTGSSNLTDCTISNDTAVNGGGIYKVGEYGGAYMELVSTTVAYNRATGLGGGLYETGENGPSKPMHSLFARNYAPTGADVFGPVSSRYSLYGDIRGITTDPDETDIVPQAPATTLNPLMSEILMDNGGPKLGPLGENGGSPYSIRTHALFLGSPAIDTSPLPEIGSNDFRDARGFPRSTATTGTPWDLGSYEAGPLEGELLFLTETTDRFVTNSETGYSNGIGTALDADAAEDYFIVEVPVPSTAAYNVVIRTKTGPNRGKFQVAYAAPGQNDFTNIGSEQGFYSKYYKYKEATLVEGFTFPAAGTMRFRFKVTGKDNSSKGHVIVLDYIRLIKQ